MLSLEEIKIQYPVELQGHERFMLREYLQYILLEIVFESEYAHQLSFLGGTCLRIVHGNQRFSEDLDFDHFNVSAKDFDKLSSHIKSTLHQQGFEVEMREIHKAAYHCYIKFPGILYNTGLSAFTAEKILIQLDSEAHGFSYTPDPFIINRFGVFTSIFTTPKDILLSQKFYAVLNRKRNKGRDFLDIVFLIGLGAKPNYDYLALKLNINDAHSLKAKVNKHCNTLDMEAMANDVAPFLFHKKDLKKVSMFPAFVQNAAL